MEKFMSTITITISDELSEQLAPYHNNLDMLLLKGLRETKLERSLTLFKQGQISIWKAARLANVSLREMMNFASAYGVYPPIDEETIQEELA
jgi:predicted HTH domain antitoxin